MIDLSCKYRYKLSSTCIDYKNRLIYKYLPGIEGGTSLTCISLLSSRFFIASDLGCFSNMVFIAGGVMVFNSSRAFFNAFVFMLEQIVVNISST